MPPLVDRTGVRYGCVVAIKVVGKDEFNNFLWECLCDCGRTRVVNSNYLWRLGKRGQKEPCRCAGFGDARAGERYGRLTVLSRANKKAQGERAKYLCRCDCGTEIVVDCGNLLKKGGHTLSCGCYQSEQTSKSNFKHGLTTKEGKPHPDRRYVMWSCAKKRAKSDKYYPFDLEPTDIVIPLVCPLLGVPLVTTNTEIKPNSPTLDKIIPELGYTKGNVWVISHRANTIKSDASLEELKMLTKNLKKKLNELDGNIGQNQPGD